MQELVQRLRHMEDELRDARGAQRDQAVAFRKQMQRVREGEMAASRAEMDQLSEFFDEVVTAQEEKYDALITLAASAGDRSMADSEVSGLGASAIKSVPCPICASAREQLQAQALEMKKLKDTSDGLRRELEALAKLREEDEARFATVTRSREFILPAMDADGG
jgi:hypothetical protein